MQAIEAKECKPDRDFLRHIVNRVLALNINKIPRGLADDVRTSIGRAEDKYKFSLISGDPMRLLDYFKSEEWWDLVDMVKNTNLTWLLEQVLKELADKYSSSCEPVAKKALELVSLIKDKESQTPRRLSLDYVVRALKYSGYQVSLKEGVAIVEEPYVKVELTVKDDNIVYTICREGKAKTIEAFMARLEKIREI
ncbi:MAG: hypothetical protein F7C07_02085 [Desulfurococcales archaeon]|nr:hypothetical protein [Desulfurococcales archaeon]